MRTFASVIAKRIQNDSLAQLVEQLTLNQWVEGSNPSGVTRVGAKNTHFFALYAPQWRCAMILDLCVCALLRTLKHISHTIFYHHFTDPSKNFLPHD